MSNLMYWKGEMEVACGVDDTLMLTRVSCYNVVPSNFHHDEEQDEVFVHWYVNGEAQNEEPSWVTKWHDDWLDGEEVNITADDLEVQGFLTH